MVRAATDDASDTSWKDVIMSMSPNHKTAPESSPPQNSVKPTQEQLDEIKDKFSLKNDILHSEKLQNQAAELLFEYRDLFGDSKQIGTTQLIQHHIRLKENAQPISLRYRPLNPSMEVSLKEQLDLWLSQEVIEPANSPWCFPLVPVLSLIHI